ncbi:oxidoreductase protein-like protein [Leptodontidium sp. MPI-SDFR-AT-0119]|nr:oxidoreductase protein-like protein [Leptodontidium sp. MPI-SDFR-AT-0119]
MASLQDKVVLPCGLVLPNCLVKSAKVEPFSGNNYIPDEHSKKLYSAWAKGEWGMILIGNVQVDPRHLGSPVGLCVDSARISDLECYQAWKEYAQACLLGPAVMQITPDAKP